MPNQETGEFRDYGAMEKRKKLTSTLSDDKSSVPQIKNSDLNSIPRQNPSSIIDAPVSSPSDKTHVPRSNLTVKTKHFSTVPEEDLHVTEGKREK